MIPRGRLDIGWRDLAAAAAACLVSRSRVTLERRVEQAWSRDEDALVCLSVRSGLDLLLTALRYPKGSEVLVSAVTIRDMVRVIEHHGLVPVPVDVDTQTLGVKMESLRRARSPKTRAVLVAHLFGSRTSLEAVSAFAREHGLLLVEDCAQAFTGLDQRGDPASDVALFSFGPIKTATALGGAVLAFRDRELLARTRALQEACVVQPRREFAKRVLRFAVVKALLHRAPFTLFCAACRLAGRSAEAWFELGRHDEAARYAGEVLALGDRHAAPYARFTLGQIAIAGRDGAAAVAHLAESMRLAQENDDLYMAAYAQRALGQAHLAAGEHELGREQLQGALARFSQLGIAGEIAATERLLGAGV